ncbi:MAG: hypothetical protein GF331_17955 [Chitinivibrionales bacterium]|nr:hypothetical protein [Chitinivibrionales bacterium]
MTVRPYVVTSVVLWLSAAGWCAKPTATITTIEGTASVLPSGADKWRTARPNMPLRIGDQVYSREQSFVEIRYMSGAVVRMNENTKLTLQESTDKGVKSHNPLGNVWVNMQKITRKRSFEMSSPTAVAAIRGTVFQMQTDEDSATSVRVYDGKVQVGPSAALQKRLEKLQQEQDDQEGTQQQDTPPDGPQTVPGPEEIPGPYEVTLEEWHAIVAGQMISVRPDGKYAQEEFDPDKASLEEFVKKNRELDEQLLEEGKE